MKKIFCLVLLLQLTLMLSSCRGAETAGEPFKVFSTGFSADITLDCNGVSSAFSTVWKPSDTASSVSLTLTLTAPERVTGYIFSGRDGKYSLVYGDISVDCNDRMGKIPEVIENTLTPDARNIVSIGTETRDGVKLTAVSTADVTYLFTRDGIPVSISGVVCGCTVKIEINSFTPES